MNTFSVYCYNGKYIFIVVFLVQLFLFCSFLEGPKGYLSLGIEVANKAIN